MPFYKDNVQYSSIIYITTIFFFWQVNRKNQLLEILSNLKLPDPINSSPNNSTSISINPLDNVSLVSTSWLCDCLNNPLLLGDACLTDAQIKSLSKLRDYIFPSSLSNQSSYTLRTCSHGHAPTDLVAGSYRAVSSEGLKKLIEILFPKSFDAIQSEDDRYTVLSYNDIIFIIIVIHSVQVIFC